MSRWAFIVAHTVTAGERSTVSNQVLCRGCAVFEVEMPALPEAPSLQLYLNPCDVDGPENIVNHGLRCDWLRKRDGQNWGLKRLSVRRLDQACSWQTVSSSHLTSVLRRNVGSEALARSAGPEAGLPFHHALASQNSLITHSCLRAAAAGVRPRCIRCCIWD